MGKYSDRSSCAVYAHKEEISLLVVQRLTDCSEKIGRDDGPFNNLVGFGTSMEKAAISHLIWCAAINGGGGEGLKTSNLLV